MVEKEEIACMEKVKKGGATTFSITSLSIMTFRITIRKCDPQLNVIMLCVFYAERLTKLNVIMLSVVMLNVVAPLRSACMLRSLITCIV